jgi:hypothetical protein
VIRNPGSGMNKNQDPGSGISIPDLQHCMEMWNIIVWNYGTVFGQNRRLFLTDLFRIISGSVQKFRILPDPQHCFFQREILSVLPFNLKQYIFSFESIHSAHCFWVIQEGGGACIWPLARGTAGREPTGFSKTHTMECPSYDGEPVDGFESCVETVKAGFPGVIGLWNW